MSINEWVFKNSASIRAHIKSVCPNCGKLDLSDLRQWVDNDETLYNWAISEGVQFED